MRQWDKLIQALVAKCSDEPFAQAIGLRCPSGRTHRRNSELLDSTDELLGENAVAVAYQEPVVVIKRQGLTKLLRRPVGC